MVNPPPGLSFKQFAQWVENATDYAMDIRKLFIPRRGKKFIMADLAQIEPRVLAWLTGNVEMLNLMAGGMSPYEAFARTSMGWTGGDLKKEDAEKYQLSKIQVLGLGYGCGWDKFITIAAGYMVYLDEEQSRQIVDAFRTSNPLITGMWKNLDDAFKGSVGSDFVFGLPSGRNMNYRDVRREVRSKKNKEGKYEKRFVYTCAVGTKRVESYGGKLTENLIQAVARDVFGAHLLRLDGNVGDVIFHVHDEAICEVDEDVTPQDVEHEMAQNPSWCDGLPTAAEAKEGYCYKK
jgi:DNA polymerase